MRRVVSGVALRTLATRGRKRAGLTSEAPWGGWSEAEGPKGNTAYDFQPTSYQLSAINHHQPISNQQAPATNQPLPPTINKEDDLQVN